MKYACNGTDCAFPLLAVIAAPVRRAFDVCLIYAGTRAFNTDMRCYTYHTARRPRRVNMHNSPTIPHVLEDTDCALSPPEEGRREADYVRRLLGQC